MTNETLSVSRTIEAPREEVFAVLADPEPIGPILSRLPRDGGQCIEHGHQIRHLVVLESRTEVTLTYDWSAVPPSLREHIPFPPFPIDHLEQSLANLARLANSG